jgi:hypothetical protein
MTNSAPTGTDQPGTGDAAIPVRDFHWRAIWSGFGAVAAITVTVGVPLMAVSDSIWWLAWVAVGGLFVGGVLAARIAQTSEPLNGAMIALLFFGVVAVGYLVGQAVEILPDPLPGLAPDNSTFFFVWPLTQIVAGPLGSYVGGRRWRLAAREEASE